MKHLQWRPAGLFGALAAALAITGVPAGHGPTRTAAATCENWTGVQPPSPGAGNDDLHGVAVISARNAWAVGEDASAQGPAQTLIERWNGASWKVVPSPDPGISGNGLSGVSAVSRAGAWAVGESFNAGLGKTLILHWNGTAWAQVPSPSPGGTANLLTGVSAVAADDAWAVGYYSSDTNRHTLILHWNGATWTQVPSPNPGRSDNLAAVATSGTSAWAVGSFGSSPFAPARPLILRWNGTGWKRVTAPSLGSNSALSSVVATSAVSAWAAGQTSSPAATQTLILHWNGTTWARTASPNPGSTHADFLQGVAATSAANAWAVGDIATSAGTNQAFILHWNGTAWARTASPDPGFLHQDFLEAVAARSSVNAWAVGAFTIRGGVNHAFALHRC